MKDATGASNSIAEDRTASSPIADLMIKPCGSKKEKAGDASPASPR